MIKMQWSRSQLWFIYWMETVVMTVLSLLFLIWFFVGIGGPWYWFAIGILGLGFSGWYYWGSAISVSQEQRRCMECFKAYIRTLGPGLHLVPRFSCRVRATTYISEQRLSLFIEPIFIDFRDGSARPKSVCAFIQMAPDLKDTQGEAGASYMMTYHITKVMEAVRSLLENVVRSYLNRLTIQEGIELGKAGYDVVEQIQNHGDANQIMTATTALEGWGLVLRRVTIGDFDLSDAVKKDREAVHRAMQQVLAMKHHVKQRSGEIAGIIVKTVAQATGRTEAATKRFIQENAELSAQVVAFTQEMISRDWSLEKEALTDIRVSGGGTGGDLLLQLIAAFRQIATTTRGD